jgi:phosphatidylglycerol:prolipoprotein diacylglycerol transferase
MDLLMPLLLTTGLAGAWGFGRLTDLLTHEAAESAVLAGSLLASTAAGIAYALACRIPLGILGDICSAPLAMGIGIGRIGCFLAGCCFGKTSRGETFLTGVRFPHGSFAFLQQVATGQLAPEASRSLAVYPVQLYEAAFCLLLSLFLAWSPGKRRVRGEQFLLLGLAYAIFRFNVEFLRGDNPPVHGLTFSQWAAILITALATGTFVLRRHYAEKLHLWTAPPFPGAVPDQV